LNLDVLIVVAYLVAVFVIGVRSGRSARTGEQYFLAGRTISWPMVGAALFATNVSAEHYVAYAGGAYADGFVTGGTELVAAINIIFLAVLFLPFYIRLGVFTTPEFLEKRFNLACRYLMSLTLIGANILTRLSVSLWAAALVLKTFLGWDPAHVVIIMGLVTMAYTLVGGLKGVIYTESLQAVVMLGSGLLLMILSLHAVGGPAQLVDSLRSSGHAGHLHWAQPIDHPTLPWTAYTLPWIVVASFYWCMDQTIVQRALGARTLDDARKGAIFAGYVKLLHLFILIVPGLCALVLYPSLSSPDEAYPTMIAKLLPTGFRGLALAGILAALMSTFASALNSTATLIVYDFVARLRPQTTDKAKVRIGRLTILLTAVVGIAWAPYIDRLDRSLWAYLMRVSMYLQAPVAGVFFLGLLWRKTTGSAAVAGIVAGCTVGAMSLLIDFEQITPPDLLRPPLEHWLLKSFPHRAFAAVLISVGTAAGVSWIQSRGSSGRRRAVPADLYVDWSNPQIFDSQAKTLWGDWRMWTVGLVVLDVFLFVILR